MKQEFILLGIVFAALVFLIWRISYHEKRRNRRLLQQIRGAYGQIPEREYAPGDLDSIAFYYRNFVNKANTVDDITWNDLDMDRVFMAVNQTWSSSGEEYLYGMLRTPCTEEATLQERERLISYFASHEEERNRISLAFRKIGKMKGLSTWEYITRLMELPERNSMRNIVQAVLGAASVISLVAAPTVGILFFIVMMCINIWTYYKQMGEDRPYISCFLYVMRLLEQAQLLEQTGILELKEYFDRMQEARRKFRKFQRNSFILKEAGSVAGDLLESIMDYFRMFFHLDIIKFNSMLGELKKHLADAQVLMEQAGILESAIAIASFRELMPYTVQPEFVEERKYQVKEMYHPLIEYPIPNDIHAADGVLITGSNASGKSTFLKTAAINAILAQTIHTALAKSYEGSFFRIVSSMALKDDLENQESYYIAEIRSLKRILDGIGEEYPTLCFVDEVLRGTNTVERIAASAQILKSLSGRNVICFAATHDIELTYILEELYENYHFAEEIDEEQIHFPYKLFAGRAMTRNAIRLLGFIGYDREIVKEAEDYAQQFLEEGQWRKLSRE